MKPILLLLIAQLLFVSCSPEAKPVSNEPQVYYRELKNEENAVSRNGQKMPYRIEVLYLLPGNKGYQFIDTRSAADIQTIIEEKMDFLSKKK